MIENTVWMNSKNRIIRDNEQLFNNLREIGLFDKYPDLGDINEAEQSSLMASLNTSHKRIFKPLEETDTIMPSHLWIGINPPPGQYTMVKLCQMTIGIVKKYKWAEDNAWCVEAHTAGGYRPHIHLMVSYNRNKVRPNRVIQMLSTSYKVEKHSIQCKTYLNGNLHGEHMDYIMGLKSDEKKDDVLSDISERNSLKIQNYYLNGIYKDADSLHKGGENVYQDSQDHLSESATIRETIWCSQENTICS